jgi:hypothetical protein
MPFPRSLAILRLGTAAAAWAAALPGPSAETITLRGFDRLLVGVDRQFDIPPLNG